MQQPLLWQKHLHVRLLILCLQYKTALWTCATKHFGKHPYFFIKKVALMRRDSNLLRRHYPDQLKGRNNSFLSANKLPCSRFVLTLYFNLIYFATFFIFTYLLLWLSQEQTSFLFQVENNAVLYHSIIKIFFCRSIISFLKEILPNLILFIELFPIIR